MLTLWCGSDWHRLAKLAWNYVKFGSPALKDNASLKLCIIFSVLFLAAKDHSHRQGG